MAKSWTIGSDPGCDLVASRPASARHARLTIGLGGAILEDLGSAEGTYVNGVRITGEVLVTRDDAIGLGPSMPMPWPDGPADLAPVVLRIGREPENDLVVNQPTVSGRHARVTWSGRPGEAEIEDLGSSNGTAIGSPERKATRSVFGPRDTVYLGTWPILGSTLLARVDPTYTRVLTPGPPELVIGRAPESDRVIDLATVSGRHARLSRSGGRVTIEDLGSSNGTFVNGRRIAAPTPLEPGDLVGLGLHMMRFAPVESPSPGRAARTLVEPIPRPDLPVPPGDRAGFGGVGSGPSRLLRLSGLLLQAPVAALLIVGVHGGRTPLLLFLLALSAAWFGLGDALFGDDPERPGSMASRIGLMGLGCVVQSVVLWGIVAGLTGLRGSWPGPVAILVMTALVGAALGLLIVLLSPGPGWKWGAVPVVLAILWLFGGGPGSLTRLSPVTGMVSSVVPTRWAFEALLLLESDATGPPTAPRPDLAEAFFPAETERMGPRADAFALAAILLGLSASAAFVSRATSAGRWNRGAT